MRQAAQAIYYQKHYFGRGRPGHSPDVLKPNHGVCYFTRRHDPVQVSDCLALDEAQLATMGNLPIDEMLVLISY
jgi:hypothetical protein